MKNTVQDAFKEIVDREGNEIFLSDLRLNSMLADLAGNDESGRKKIRLALSSGAGKLFYRMIQRNSSELQRQDIRMFRSSMEGNGFTAEFSDYVLNVFLYSVSMPGIPSEESYPAPESGKKQVRETVTCSPEADDPFRTESRKAPGQETKELKNQPKTKPAQKSIPNLKAGEIITFGRYPQDRLERAAKPIEWLVLEVQGSTALLISKYGLDSRPYHPGTGNVTWETSSVREWLNRDFMQAAFSPAEQAAILLTDVSNSKYDGESFGYVTGLPTGGNNTRDRIFLLSCREAGRYFGASGSDSSNIRARVAPTEYAMADSSKRKLTAEGKPAGWWWLRSPGMRQSQAAMIRQTGLMSCESTYLNSGCVRPAFWMNLKAGAELIRR